MASDYELIQLDKIKDSKLSVQSTEIKVNPEY